MTKLIKFFAVLQGFLYVILIGIITFFLFEVFFADYSRVRKVLFEDYELTAQGIDKDPIDKLKELNNAN